MINRRALLAAAAAVLAMVPGCAAANTVALKRAGGHLLIPVTVAGRTVDAVLDTAAEVSVLDTTFARELGLRGGARATARGSGAATIETRLVKGVTLSVAGLTLRPAAVAVIDLGDIGRRLIQRPVAMILGREFFDASRIAVDLQAATLRPVDRSEAPRGVRLALTTRRGIEQVPVTIEGHAGTADFDIGNGGRVLLGGSFAARAGLLTNRPTGRIGGGGIGGEALQTTLTIGHLELAGQRFEAVPAAIDANPEASDVNIGTGILGAFNLVVDFSERAVWLDPRS